VSATYGSVPNHPTKYPKFALAAPVLPTRSPPVTQSGNRPVRRPGPAPARTGRQGWGPGRAALTAAEFTSEAVELAKEYSTDGSSGFVNGILATIAHELRPDEDKLDVRP
jgi:hypothetical protein